MSHTFLFRMQITFVVLVWSHFNRYIFYDFQTVCFETYALYRIVSEQDAFCVHRDGGASVHRTIVALVWLETEINIGVNGILAFFLKLVGFIFSISPMPRPS